MIQVYERTEEEMAGVNIQRSMGAAWEGQDCETAGWTYRLGMGCGIDGDCRAIQACEEVEKEMEAGVDGQQSMGARGMEGSFTYPPTIGSSNWA